MTDRETDHEARGRCCWEKSWPRREETAHVLLIIFFACGGPRVLPYLGLFLGFPAPQDRSHFVVNRPASSHVTNCELPYSTYTRVVRSYEMYVEKNIFCSPMLLHSMFNVHSTFHVHWPMPIWWYQPGIVPAHVLPFPQFPCRLHHECFSSRVCSFQWFKMHDVRPKT